MRNKIPDSPCLHNFNVPVLERGSLRARERGSEGARERGSEGAWERGSLGAREPESEGARERGQLSSLYKVNQTLLLYLLQCLKSELAPSMYTRCLTLLARYLKSAEHVILPYLQSDFLCWSKQCVTTLDSCTGRYSWRLVYSVMVGNNCMKPPSHKCNEC